MFKKLVFPMVAIVLTVGLALAVDKDNLLNVYGTGSSRDTNMFYIENDGDAVFTQDVAITGTLTTTGAQTQNGDVTIGGTTPALTIGDAGAEDTALIYDGNAQDFYIGLDDSVDDLVFGLGSAIGTTPAFAINESQVTTFSQDPVIGGTTPNLTIGDAGEEDTSVTFDGNADDFYIALDDSADDLVIGYGSTVGTDSRLTVVDDASSTQLVVGDAAAEDMQIRFDGNAQDFHIGLDDSVDDLVIGLGSALGTTSAIAIDENLNVTLGKHLSTVHASTSPTVSSCGTTPSIVGSDASGKVTIGTSASDTCTLTFQTAYAAAPACVVVGEDSAITLAATTTTSALVITAPSATDFSGDVIMYVCIGQDGD